MNPSDPSPGDASGESDEEHEDVAAVNNAVKSVSNDVEPGDVDRPIENGKKSGAPLRAALITTMLLLFGVAALNWPYQHTVSASHGLGTMQTPVDFSLTRDVAPILGGWPFRYYVAYEATDAQAGHRVMSLRALLYNIALAMIPIAIAAIYIYRRTMRTSAGRLAGKRITIADLLAITLLLAAPLGLWQRFNAVNKAEQALAKKIQLKGGAVYLETWLPDWLASRVPESINQSLKKIRGVRLESATDDILTEIVNHRSLTTLRIGGDEYDLRLLDELVANPLISEIRVGGRVVDVRALQAIAAHSRLRTLNLMRTNVSAESMKLFDGLSLRRLNLIHSDIKLSDLGTPKWSRTIQTLRLSHPEPGQSDSLEISGWPKLETLQINELDTQTNSSVMKVTLVDLPELKELGLDVFQKFDLTLRNLPKLEKITELDYEWRSRIPRKGAAPGHIWYSRLDFENLPVMDDMDLFAVDLEQFRIVGAPKIENLGIGAFFRTYSNTPYARELTPKVATGLITGIGNSEGPFRIDLDAVPLKGVDLSPLKNNKGLKQLMLSQSDTTIQQWKSLEGMTWLTRLDIKDCPIDSEGIKWILDSFPELEHFAFSPSSETFYTGKPLSLEIIDRPKLKVLDLGNISTQIFQKIRIVNSPQIGLALKLGFVRQLEIRGSKGVTGITVDAPLPKGVKLQGLRDLKFFAVGGSGVTDETIDAIVDCKELDTLTLAYPSVTASGLKKLVNIGSVSSLNLPGAAVDDSVVAAWPALENVATLDLSDTKITGASLPKLLSSGRGRRIQLDRTSVSPSDLEILGDQLNIESLSLAGVGIDAPTIKAVLDGGSLRRLDLSDSKIDAKVFDELISQGNTLQYLILRNSEVDNDKLFALARRYSQLVFDLSGSDASTRVQSGLVSAGRMVDADEWQQRQMMQQMMAARQRGYAAGTSFEPELPAMIQVENFRPRTGANINNPAPIVRRSGGLGQWLSQAFAAGNQGTDNSDTQNVASDEEQTPKEADDAQPDAEDEE